MRGSGGSEAGVAAGWSGAGMLERDHAVPEEGVGPAVDGGEGALDDGGVAGDIGQAGEFLGGGDDGAWGAGVWGVEAGVGGGGGGLRGGGGWGWGGL